MAYIEREALLEKRQTVGICDAAGNCYGAADVVFVDDIEAAPAADVMAKTKRFVLTAEKMEWAYQMKQEGYPQKEIARALGVTPSALCKQLAKYYKDNGIMPHKGKRLPLVYGED